MKSVADMKRYARARHEDLLRCLKVAEQTRQTPMLRKMIEEARAKRDWALRRIAYDDPTFAIPKGDDAIGQILGVTQ